MLNLSKRLNTGIRVGRNYNTVLALDSINAQIFDQGTFIDVRQPREYAEWAPKDFKNIPFYEIIDDGVDVPSDKPIYLSCDWGYKSAQVAKNLESRGYKNVNVINGGMLLWLFYGGPIAFPSEKKEEVHQDQTPSLQQMIQNSKKLGIDLGFMEGVRHPRLDSFFSTKEEQDEILQTPPLLDVNKM